MEFRELNDVEWNIIKTLLPPKPKRGRKASSDDRSLINGILYVITTGCRWREMPRKYGSYVTAWRRLRRLQELGIWERIMNLLSSTRSCENVAVDSTTIEAKRGGECVGYDGFKHRKGTKVHVMVDEDSKPLAVVISPGNTHDSRMFDEVYGRLRDRPLRLYGDSAYDTDEIRLKLERDGVQANIPVNPRNGRRPIPYDERGYRVMKSAVERFNSWLKTFRRAVVRYERLAVMFQAIITFTCIMIHMRYGL